MARLLQRAIAGSNRVSEYTGSSPRPRIGMPRAPSYSTEGFARPTIRIPSASSPYIKYTDTRGAARAAAASAATRPVRAQQTALRGFGAGRVPGSAGMILGGGLSGMMLSGNASPSAFAWGMIGGAVGGYALQGAGKLAYKQVLRAGLKGNWAATARAITGKSSRGYLFAAGALLGSGVFSSVFAGSGSSHKRGFNANRGNSIVR